MRPTRSATSELLPWAMFANGPQCIRHGWPSRVWIRFGLIASRRSDRHRAGAADLLGRHGLAVRRRADGDRAEPPPQVLQVRRDGHDRHDLGGGGDVEAGLARDAVELAAEPRDDVAQVAVVDVDDAAPGDRHRVELRLVAVQLVRVDEGREQVVGGRDGVDVAGEVEVQVLHRHDLRPAAAGRAALDAEDGPERRLAQGEHRLLADHAEALRQRDGGRRLALAGRGRRDRRDVDDLRVGAALQALQHAELDLGLVAAVQLDLVVLEPRRPCDVDDGLELVLLGDLQARLHDAPDASADVAPAQRRPRRARPRGSYRPPQAPDATPVVQQSSLSLCVDSPQCTASSARVPLILVSHFHIRTPFGLRPVSEFSYGGEARPLYDPNASEAEEIDRLWLRRNACGVQRERWFHTYGTPPLVHDRARHAHEHGARAAGRGVHGRGRRGHHLMSIDFEGNEVPAAAGRHGRLGPLPQRRPHVLALLQVPPPARPVLRVGRLPELPGDRRRRGRRARVRVRGEGRADGRAPERVAVRRPRRAERLRQDALGDARRLLLQVDGAARSSPGPWRRRSSARRRASASPTRRSPARPRARQPAPRRARHRRRRRRPGRGARRRRRTAAACCSWTRTRSPVRASRPARRVRRSTACAALVDGHAGVERLADAACIGLYEGPLAVVVAPDVVHHVHPQAIVVACGGMEAHQLFKGNDLPGVFLARGAARLAGVHGIKPGDRAVVWAQQPEALVHARTLADAGVAIAAVVTAPGVDASATGFRAVRRRGRRGARARSASRASSCARRAAAARRSRATCWRVGAEIQPNHHLPRLAYDLPVVLAGECTLTEPGSSLDDAVESGKQAGIAAARGLQPYTLPPNAAPKTLRLERLRLHLRGRRREGRRDRDRRGLRLRRAAQALHDGHHGPVPGAAVRRAAAHDRRARDARRRPNRVGQPTTLRPPVRPLRAGGGRRRRPPPHRAAHGPAREAPRAPARRPCGPARGSASRRTAATSTASTGRCASASA